MDWELHNGAQLVGPCSEHDIVTAISAGRLGPPTLCRAAGEPEWRPLRSHPTFAMALDGAFPSQAHQTQVASPAGAKHPDSSAVVLAKVVGGATALVCAFGGTLWCASLSEHASSRPATTPPLAAPEPAPAAAEATRATHLQEAAEHVMALSNLNTAIVGTLAAMSDTQNESSSGAMLLALWTWKKGRWSDFDVKDETTFGKVQKDSDAERGRHYCASGSLVEIAAQKFEGGKIDVGLLMDDSMRLFHFLSGGSSGALVAQSPARFCGIVTGKFDYSNSAGGVGHAVEIVGMFDLPANRKKR